MVAAFVVDVIDIPGRILRLPLFFSLLLGNFNAETGSMVTASATIPLHIRRR
jgi:hypothetical protein